MINRLKGEVTQCPEVPSTMPKYDWECDPRNGTCAEGKFRFKGITVDIRVPGFSLKFLHLTLEQKNIHCDSA